MDADLKNVIKPTTLIITEPTEEIARDLVALLDHAILTAPGLRIVGVWHEKGGTDIAATRALLQRHQKAPITLQKVDCEIDAETVFQENGCTGTFRQLLNASDGIIFSGGPDLPPALFGGKTHLTTKVGAPHRHYFEVSFLAHLLGTERNPDLQPMMASRPGYLVFGLCLGMQAMNVAMGGTLVQDIPMQVYGITTAEEVLDLPLDEQHVNYRRTIDPRTAEERWIRHRIRLLNNRLVAGELPGEDTVPVLCSHHQAIDTLAPDLEVLATSTDGKIIEAVGHKTYPNVLGVQFHIERRVLWKPYNTRRKNGPGKSGNWDEHVRMADFNRAIWKRISKALQRDPGKP